MYNNPCILFYDVCIYKCLLFGIGLVGRLLLFTQPMNLQPHFINFTTFINDLKRTKLIFSPTNLINKKVVNFWGRSGGRATTDEIFEITSSGRGLDVV